jgi:hypothetical protein
MKKGLILVFSDHSRKMHKKGSSALTAKVLRSAIQIFYIIIIIICSLYTKGVNFLKMVLTKGLVSLLKGSISLKNPLKRVTVKNHPCAIHKGVIIHYPCWMFPKKGGYFEILVAPKFGEWGGMEGLSYSHGNSAI